MMRWSALSLLVLVAACRSPLPRSARGAAAPPGSSAGALDPFAESEARARAGIESPYEAPRKTTLIVNGTVMTATGVRHEPGYVLLDDGVIAEVGAGTRAAPVGAVVVDARGKFVTPGIIDPHSHLGVDPTPDTLAHDDTNEMTDPVTAGVRAEHSIWPEDPGIERAVAGGVTTIAVLPGSANLIGGRGFVLHMDPQRGARAMRFPGAPEILKMACGENPKRVYREQKKAPSTRMANLRNLREALVKAQKYKREWTEYLEKTAEKQKGGNADKKDTGKPPDRDLSLETLALLLSGKILVEWHCYQADDMLSALQVADEFGFRVRAFHHALEAYKIRDILAKRDIGVATWADWYGFKMEAYDGIPENLALVHDAGGRAIVHSDSPLGIQVLNQEAGKALAAGQAAGIRVTEDDAIQWLTVNPAWALGIDDQVGTLEPGKRADVVVWNRNPLSVYARAEKVFIDGRLVHDVSRPAAPWSDFELGQQVPDGGPDNARAPEPSARPKASDADVRPGPQLVVRSGTVYVPGPAQPLSEGTVIISGDRIKAVVSGSSPPTAAPSIDARGKVVTAGFIDASTQIGVAEVSLEAPTVDVDLTGDPLQPAFRVADAYNPRSVVVPITRLGGVTSAIVAPTRGILGGSSALVDLVGGNASEALVKPTAAQYAWLDEATAQKVTGTRGGNLMKLREALDDARFYATRRAAYDQNRTRSFSIGRLQLEALQPVLRGEEPLVITAHRASDIEAALRVADEFKLRLILAGASEAWMLKDELAKRKVPVVLDPMETLPARFESLHGRPDQPAILSQAGVTVVLATFSTHQSRTLRQLAGNAVRFGLDHDAAVRAITESPADAFGIRDRGRIEAGAVANVIVWSGDPLESSTRIEHVIVRGQDLPLDSRQRRLLERYRALPFSRAQVP